MKLNIKKLCLATLSLIMLGVIYSHLFPNIIEGNAVFDENIFSDIRDNPEFEDVPLKDVTDSVVTESSSTSMSMFDIISQFFSNLINFISKLFGGAGAEETVETAETIGEGAILL